MSKLKKNNASASPSLVKILSFCPYYPPHTGGLEKYAQELNENLTRKNYHITVFTSHLPKQALFPNHSSIEIITFPAFDIIFNFPIPKFWHPRFWISVYQLLTTNYHLVLSTTRFFITTPMAMLYAKSKRLPWLHIEHGSEYVTSQHPLISVIARLVDETIGRITFKFSNLNIAPSKSAAAFINRFDKRPVPVIYRGMPYQEIAAITPDKTIKKQYPDKTIVVFAGRFIDSKGISDLINAVNHLKEKDSIAVLLIGAGPAEKAIKDLVSQLNLGQTIHLLGQKTFPEIIAILKTADIMVNPSYNEGLPTIVLEAALTNTAIIATDVGGTSEIVTDDKSSQLITPQNTSQLASVLSELVADEELRLRLTSSAKDETAHRFNWEKATAAYHQEINRILAR